MSLTKVSNSMITGAALNVLDYGAVADGVFSSGTTTGTDNYQAFTDALAAAVSTKVNKVIAPAGSYYISQKLVIPQGVQLVGYGPTQMLFYIAGPQFGTVLLIRGASGDDCLAIQDNTSRQGLYNLQVYNVGSASIRAVVSVIANYYVTFRDVGIHSLIESTGAGLYIGSTTTGQLQLTLWCEFDNVIVDGNTGLYYGLLIEGQTLANNFVGGQYTGTRSGLKINSSIVCAGTSFTGVKFDYLWKNETAFVYAANAVAVGPCYMAKTIDLTNANAVTFTGCYCEEKNVPSTYNDGTHGTLFVVGAFFVDSTCVNVSTVNMSWNSVYVVNNSASSSFDSSGGGTGNTGIRIATRPIPIIQGEAFSYAVTVPTATWTQAGFNSFGSYGGYPGSLSFNTTTNQASIAQTGMYQFNVQVSLTGWTPSTTAEYATIRTNLLGAGNINMQGNYVRPISSSIPLTLTMNFTRAMTAGDIVYFEVYQNSGTSKDTLADGRTWLNAVQLN